LRQTALGKHAWDEPLIARAEPPAVAGGAVGVVYPADKSNSKSYCAARYRRPF